MYYYCTAIFYYFLFIIIMYLLLLLLLLLLLAFCITAILANSLHFCAHTKQWPVHGYAACQKDFFFFVFQLNILFNWFI